MLDPGITKKITVSSINCNSLNSSVASKNNRNLKVHGITKLSTDVVFLCDLRLSNKQLVSSENEIRKAFQLNMYDGYDCFFNSTKNKRGVGILINKKISYAVLGREDDPEENFILLHIDLAGENLVIASVYGPNSTDLTFFTKLKTGLRSMSPNNSVPVIVGGDWNCTYSADPVNVNIDVINMVDLPNKRHSEAVLELCTELGLTDPYRILHFNKRDFSYVPRCPAQKNRSRIDFFLISEQLINTVSSCEIVDTVQNKLFDHKAILLSLNNKKKSMY
jgi:exonuclease III